ncbi:MAG: glycine zipper family protein [Puniceicoccales bacterium]
MKTLATIFSVTALAGMSLVLADTLELRNGSSLQGAYEGGTASAIRFNFNGTSQDYPRDTVKSLTFSEQAPEVATASVPTPAQAQQSFESSDVTIPAGTNLLASLQAPINSGSARPGQTFPAVLVSDVRVNNQVVLPSGSNVQIQVVDSSGAGRGFWKDASVSFTVNAVNYNGQMVAVRTTSQKETKDGESGKEVLGGAARGAAMGAIFGAITGDAGDGAAGGAAAGSAGSFIRKGDNIEYQAGSVLAFTLESPVKL